MEKKAGLPRGAKAPVPNGSSAVRRRTKSGSVMAALGLPDFEKPSACKKRQRALGAALGTLPDGQIVARDLARIARERLRSRRVQRRLPLRRGASPKASDPARAQDAHPT